MADAQELEMARAFCNKLDSRILLKFELVELVEFADVFVSALAEERKRCAKYIRDRGTGHAELTESIAQAIERGDEW